ncbi:MAG: L-serine ammonia-lyase, iron-sulfur-dependent, subunit alpha [Clostridium sp.]|nr:L-serine ammonia-lyase, iron-sulfur-dependent, subunit alpha [Clostridium sp.]
MSDRSVLNVKDIYDFAKSVKIEDVKELLDKQIQYNLKIAEEGLSKKYGVNVGKMLLECYGTGVLTKIRAYAAAGSDARMSGCSLPVVTNSGSGNQGMTTSLPVIIYAKESCAAKIASSLDAAMMGHFLAMKDISFKEDCGIVKETVEDTISAVGRLARKGMKDTDTEVLKIMLNQ